MGSDLPLLLNPDSSPSSPPSSPVRPVSTIPIKLGSPQHQPTSTSRFYPPTLAPNRSPKRSAALLDDERHGASTNSRATVLGHSPPPHRASTPKWTAVNHPRPNLSIPPPRINGKLSRTAASHQSEPQQWQLSKTAAHQRSTSPNPSKRLRRSANPTGAFSIDSTVHSSAPTYALGPPRPNSPILELPTGPSSTLHPNQHPLTPPDEISSPNPNAQVSPTSLRPSPSGLRAILSPYVQFAATSLALSPLEFEPNVTPRPFSSSGPSSSQSLISHTKRRRSVRFIDSTANMQMMPPPRPAIDSNSHAADEPSSNGTHQVASSPASATATGSPWNVPFQSSSVSDASVGHALPDSSEMSSPNNQSVSLPPESRSCNCHLAMIEKWGTLNQHAQNSTAPYYRSLFDYISRLEGHRTELKEIIQEVRDEACPECGKLPSQETKRRMIAISSRVLHARSELENQSNKQKESPEDAGSNENLISKPDGCSPAASPTAVLCEYTPPPDTSPSASEQKIPSSAVFKMFNNAWTATEDQEIPAHVALILNFSTGPKPSYVPAPNDHHNMFRVQESDKDAAKQSTQEET